MNTAEARIRLEELFASRTLLHPLDDTPSSMALFRAVASLCGHMPAASEPPGTDGLRRKIGAAEHYLLILVDGLGCNLPLPKNGFFERFFDCELRAIFPSTTASVLTSLATGHWPGQHAVPGWNVYLPERGLAVKPVLFRDRMTGKPLQRLGVKPEEVYVQPAIMNRFTRRTRTYMPARIAKETFARYCRGDTAFRGYRSASDAVDRIIAHLKHSRRPGYSYFYYPDVDKTIHEKGLTDPATVEMVAGIDAELGRLKAEGIPGVRMIVTADHGLVDVPPESYLLLRDDDDLVEPLLTAPTGESRLPIFHLKSGADAAFQRSAERTLGTHFLLLPSGEAEELRLFGPEPLSPAARARLGDYIGVPTGAAVLEYVPSGRSPRHLRSFHGGLSADEMRVPLFLA